MILCFFWQRYIRGKKLGRAFWILVGILIAGMVVFYVYRMYLYFPDKSPMTIGEDGIFSEYIKPFLPEAESDGNPYTN